MSAIVAAGLGKRYGRRWALRDCTLEIPTGSVVGLVGANGAGHVLSGGAADRVLAEACNLTRTGTEAAYMRCADQLGLHEDVKAHPASQFWTLQIWESIAFLGLAVALVAACHWWAATARRDPGRGQQSGRVASSEHDGGLCAPGRRSRRGGRSTG